MIHLVYISRAVEGITDGAVGKILETARRNNPGLGITGVLHFDGVYFMQVLEGDRAQVNGLFAKISRDPRHRDVQVLAWDRVERRHFPSWAMARLERNLEIQSWVENVRATLDAETRPDPGVLLATVRDLVRRAPAE